MSGRDVNASRLAALIRIFGRDQVTNGAWLHWAFRRAEGRVSP